MSHCWHGKLEDADARFGWRSAEYQRILHGEDPDGICLLPDGHDGPHKYTDKSQIVIRFSAERTPSPAREGTDG